MFPIGMPFFQFSFFVWIPYSFGQGICWYDRASLSSSLKKFLIFFFFFLLLFFGTFSLSLLCLNVFFLNITSLAIAGWPPTGNSNELKHATRRQKRLDYINGALCLSLSLLFCIDGISCWWTFLSTFHIININKRRCCRALLLGCYVSSLVVYYCAIKLFFFFSTLLIYRFTRKNPSTFSVCLLFFFKFLLLFLYRLMMREVPIHSNGLPTSRKTPRRESLMMWCRFCVSDGRFTEKTISPPPLYIRAHTQRVYMRNTETSLSCLYAGGSILFLIFLSPLFCSFRSEAAVP